jgi:SpoVK/Ycf46/Vps4 family AAA+-type ATPase
MSNPLLRVLTGVADARRIVETVVPRRSFDDVILPPSTRRSLEQALTHVTRHDLIFNRWGLGERHPTSLALAFNFAGAPGTGKTICAEAIAHALGRRLLIVRYAEVESMWMGETPKNIVAAFRIARKENAVLLFDEADAIASRRSASLDHAFVRETNTVISVLLQELERFTGVVIFATNLAANFDPAFERRIRTHVLFEMPGAYEREQIWRVQMHPRTPLADDVDFRSLARQFEASGGDIRNAVLKAAQAAAAEPGSDAFKAIHQCHLEEGMREVLAGKKVMHQSLLDANPSMTPLDKELQRIEAARAPGRITARALTLIAMTSGLALLLALVALMIALLR